MKKCKFQAKKGNFRDYEQPAWKFGRIRSYSYGRYYLKQNKVDTSKTQRRDSFLNFQIVKFQAPFPADPIIIDIDYYTESTAFYSLLSFVSELRYSFIELTRKINYKTAFFA